MRICYRFLFIFTWSTSKIIAIINCASIDTTLPKFIIIGAQKSGTGAFYQILRQHPQIVDRPGEIHFFDIYFDEGIEWYKAQFPKSNHPEAIRGDKSPYYLFHPLVAKRMYLLLPKVKLIVLLRNPIDRAYSQYWMNVRKKRELLSFADAIKAEPERLKGEEEEIIKTVVTQPISNHRQFSYLSRSLYVEQLSKWLNYYPLDQMLIISLDDFLHNPEKTIQETLIFLELPEYHNFNFHIGKKNTYPPMDPALRKELSDYFRPHNEQLEALLNRKFNWN